MAEMEHRPGEWPDISRRGEYQRLVKLAKRRLVGHEHHAEDVVSRALIKWSMIPSGKASVARIEQVIKSEASSVLRTELRSRQRDTRAVHDPALPTGSTCSRSEGHELRLLRRAAAEVCKREDIHLTTADVEVFELLLIGHSLADVARVTLLSRHQVRRSQRKWRRILTKLDLEMHLQP